MDNTAKESAAPLVEVPSAVPARTIRALERLDDLAHIAVAVVLFVMTAAVILYLCVVFARQVPLIVAAFHGPVTGGGHGGEVDPFLRAAVDLLSNILFVVIVLEVLRTVLTYLQSRSIMAIVKDFLVVGILTIVRRLLLIGAESALMGERGQVFVESSLGALISILGILLLVAALIAVQRGYGDPKDKF